MVKKKLLEQNKIVIAEDYTGTGLAWGMAKGVSLDWLESVNSPLLKEDFAIFMDGERFLHGEEENHIHEKNSKLMACSLEAHKILAEKYGWIRVHANASKEHVSEMIWRIVCHRI